MKARALGTWRGVVWLALVIGCASTVPPTPSQVPAPRPISGSSLASLPRDVVPGPASGSKPATTSSARPSGSCSGEVKAELVSMLSTKAAQSRRCYDKLLSTQPSARGSYVVNMRVNARGKVEHARLVTDEVGDPAMARCVLERFRSATYPKPSGGCADIEVPLRYEPRRTAQN